MRLLIRMVLCSLLLVAARESSAQTTITLDKDVYGNGDKMQVTVTPPAGRSVGKPRFHFIADGMPLPKKSSSRWIEFPAIETTQKVTLVVPDAVEREESASWWLLLFDGDHLVARTPFDLMGWLMRLQLERARLESELAGAGESPGAASPETGAGSAMPAPTTAAGDPSPRGYLRMNLLEPVIGEVFTVIVTLPPVSPGEPASASLVWGKTEGLSWDEKEKTPALGDSISSEVPGTATGPQSISVTAPFAGPGRYELRLFRGQRLLDVVGVTVTG